MAKKLKLLFLLRYNKYMIKTYKLIQMEKILVMKKVTIRRIVLFPTFGRRFYLYCRRFLFYI